MASNVNFYDVVAKGGLTPAERFENLTKDGDSFYTVGNDIYLGSQKLNNGADLAAAIESIAQNSADITTINNTLTKLENTESTSGSIRNIIRQYLDALDSTATIASKSGNIISIRPQVEQVNGTIAPAGVAIDLAAVASTGAAEDVSFDNTATSLSAVTVQGALVQIAHQSAGGVGSKTVYITETAGQSTDPFSKRYGVYQGGNGSTSSPVSAEKLVDIDIPKDMVVESGTVGTVTVVDEPYAGAQIGDKYIDLVIANATSDHIYIPANSLVDIYTVEQGASQIQLAISDNEISATVVAGSITATELASNAVTTAKIADENVTKAKLAQGVQSSLDLADSAVQSVTEGATAGTIAVDGTDVAVHGLASVATSGDADDVAYDNSTSGMTATNAQDALDELKDAIDNIDVSGDIQTAIEALDGTAGIASKSGKKVTLKAGVVENDGVVSNSSDADIELADVATTGDAADVVYSSILSVAGAIDDIYGQIGGGGTVDQKIQSAIDALDTSSDIAIASVSGSIVTIAGAIKEEDGIVKKGSAADITLAKVAKTGKGEDVALTDAGNYFDTDDVESALQSIAQRLTWQEV